MENVELFVILRHEARRESAIQVANYILEMLLRGRREYTVLRSRIDSLIHGDE